MPNVLRILLKTPFCPNILSITVETTTQEIKYGRNINAWAAFLNVFFVISLSIIAKPTSKITPKTIKARLYRRVFRVSAHSLPDIFR